MNGFDGGQLINDLAVAHTPDDRFRILTTGFEKIGLNNINYGIFDAQAAELNNADIQFMSTMSDDWMQYYYDRGLQETDTHVLRVKDRKITPYVWGETLIQRLEHNGERTTALEAAEAGLCSALLVPLTSPSDPFVPVGGMALGSSLKEDAFKMVLREHGATLLSIAYLFHNISIRQVLHEQGGNKLLSTRERDCMSHLAAGKRQDAIAYTLGVKLVTVEMYLRAARTKLKARTLNEAVAKALILGEISLDS